MRAESPAIHVHAGTHCAAAEAFGDFLETRSAAITAARWGVALADSDDPAAAPASVAAARHDIESGSGRGLLISDRSLAGPARQLLEGRFYPDARARAEALSRAIGADVDRLVLVVQPYDTILRRAWAAGRTAAVGQFADVAPRLADFAGGWHDLVGDLREGLRARRVIVLAAPQEPQAILGHLVPDLAADLLNAGREAPPMTSTFRATLSRLAAQGLRLAPGQKERLMAFHARLSQPRTDAIDAVAAEHSGFTGLPLADLRGRYVADLDALARLPGVSLIGGLMAGRPAWAAE